MQMHKHTGVMVTSNGFQVMSSAWNMPENNYVKTHCTNNINVDQTFMYSIKSNVDVTQLQGDIDALM